jgi:hypothetical protein
MRYDSRHHHSNDNFEHAHDLVSHNRRDNHRSYDDMYSSMAEGGEV